MKVLGIDTSTKTMSMAIVDGDRILGELNFYANMDHSEKIMDNLMYLLKSTDTSLSDLDLMAVAEGPGSFTGIRIGIATIKGLCEFSDIPVVAVSSLEILAANIKRGIVTVAIDAKRDRVYGYIKNQDTDEIIAGEDLYDLDDFRPLIPEDSIVLTDLEELDIGTKGQFREEINSAAELCRLAIKNSKNSISHLGIEANYMTKSQAELQREKKVNK